jgi:hypothetical protein
MITRTTILLDQTLLGHIQFLAKVEKRSVSKQIEYVLERYVVEQRQLGQLDQRFNTPPFVPFLSSEPQREFIPS